MGASGFPDIHWPLRGRDPKTQGFKNRFPGVFSNVEYFAERVAARRRVGVDYPPIAGLQCLRLLRPTFDPLHEGRTRCRLIDKVR
jgi:hypothetical protein